VVKLTQADFLSKVFDYKANKSKWKYLGDKPCIIDFYADWCAPCRKVAPILGELAKEYEGRVIIYKVDVEAEKELARDLDIQSLPTLLYCPVEGEPQVLMGLQPKENYIKAISEILNVQ
ncbi:MAG: thioredoxin family protein, partial [Bacteroidales bacterium]